LDLDLNIIEFASQLVSKNKFFVHESLRLLSWFVIEHGEDVMADDLSGELSIDVL